MSVDGNDISNALLGGCGVAGMAEYQDGSVVSRTLVKKKAGTVTLFAFAKGQGLSEHKTPYDALVHILDGSGEFVVGGNAHDIRAGDMLLLPANVPHEVRATERFKMLLTMIRSE